MDETYDDVRYRLTLRKPKGSYGEYYARAPEVVMRVVESAVKQYGREVSLREIQQESYFCLGPDERVYSPYGYTPFDFPDRLRRWLRRLVRQGRLLELRDRRKYFYLPTDHGEACLLAERLEPLVDAYKDDAKFAGDHVTPDLPGEIHDREL